jgi:hypothetical protein
VWRINRAKSHVRIRRFEVAAQAKRERNRILEQVFSRVPS